MKSKRIRKRAGAVLLSAAMVFSMPGTSVFATADSGRVNQASGLCEHHPEHNEECGYEETASPSNAAKTSCTYVCEICSEADAKTNEKDTAPDSSVYDPEDCICEEACTAEVVDGDCPLCGWEVLGWKACSLAEIADEEDGDLYSSVITAWDWVDDENNLQGNDIILAEGAGTVTFKELQEVLPAEITARVQVVSDGAEKASPSDADEEIILSEDEYMEETIEVENWSCKSYPRGGAFAGSYKITAELPAGYVLAEGTAPLAVNVKFAGMNLATSSNAAKIGETEYETLAEALEQAQPDDIIVLLNHVAEKIRIGKLEGASSITSDRMNVEMVPVADNVTLDLNGKTLEGKGEASDAYPLGLYHVNDFTITDTAAGGIVRAGAGEYAVYAEDSSLTINGGAFHGGSRALELTRSDCTVNAGTFEADSYTVYVGRESSLEIDNGVFTSTGSGADAAALYVTPYCETVSLNGGTYKGEKAGVRVSGSSSIGSILGDGKGFYGEDHTLVSNTAVKATDAAVTVSDSDTPPVLFVAVTDITGIPTAATAGTDLTLTGTVNPSDATNQDIIWKVSDPGTTGAVISGSVLKITDAGTAIVTAVVANGAAEGTDYTKDFTITVSAGISEAAARIDTVSYHTLREAFEHAKTGNTIVLLENVNEKIRIGVLGENASVTGDKMDLVPAADSLTLDLNGNTFTCGSDYPLGIYGIDGFTVKDSGNGGAITSAADYAVYAEDASLNINSGIFRGGKRALELTRSDCTIGSGTFEAGDYAVYVGRESSLKVENGSFKSTGSVSDSAALFVSKYSGEVVLSGGIYEGNKAAVRTAGRAVGSILAEEYGYKNTKTGTVITDLAVLKGNVVEPKVEIVKAEMPAEVKTYTITFDANGGSVSPVSAETDAGGRLSVLPAPVRTGNYRFAGWFTEINGGTQVRVSHVYKSDTTIYAHWIGTGSGSGGSSGGSSGGGSGSGGGPSYNSAPSATLISVPNGYSGGTKVIGRVRVPDYTVEGQWSLNEAGKWNLKDSDGQMFANTWVAAFNPYADVAAGQSAFDWFLFDAEGNMMTGWYTDESGDTYYLNPVSDNTLGAMAIGWRLIDLNYYYFNDIPDGTRGKLLKSTTTPEGYYVNENGVWDGTVREDAKQ